jgi:hypothetical protein
MTGVCSEVIDDLRKDIQKMNNPQHVRVAGFSRVMNLYFKYWMEEVINNKGIMKLHNKLGSLFVIKTLCIRYNPKKVYFVEENGVKIRKSKPIQLKNGKWPFMFWDCGKRWRMYKFTPSKKWKKLIYENFFDKDMDYVEMSLEDYGRNASPSYIQMIR